MAYETESPLINGASNNTTATSNLLTSGARMTAALGTSSDVDYFSVNTSGAALISLDFTSPLLTTSKHWQIRLLNSSGDYLQTLATSAGGTPAVNGASQTGSTLAIDGLTSLPAAGSKFTFVTANVADTTVYTVVSATSLSAGATTLTLDKALPTGSAAPADNTLLAFDPAQVLTGVSTNLTAKVSVEGTYYVQVLADGAVYNSSDYSLTATVLPTTENEGNATREDAVASNNRLLAGVEMTGALSSATDVDYWVFSTARASDFSVAFASAAGDPSTNQWKIDVTEWSGATLPNNAGALTAGTSASASIDDAVYGNATTFLAKVSAVSSSAFNTGNYTLKVSGTGLDLNEAPVLTVGTVSNTLPNALVSTGVVRSIAADSTGVALSSLFSASDADSGQSVTYYKFSLTKGTGVTSDAYIRVGDSSAYTYYGFGAPSGATAASSGNVTLTAAQMATASFFPGTTAASTELSLALQAFDSTSVVDDDGVLGDSDDLLGGADSSGASAILTQTLKIVGTGYGVTTDTTGTKTALSENLGGQGANMPHSTTFSMALTQAPASDVKIYLTDVNNQLDLSAAVLTFTVADSSASNYWSKPQTVTVTATADTTAGGAGQTAGLSFQVISLDTTYDGFIVQPLAFTVDDNATPALTALTAIAYTDTSAADTFDAPTSGSTTGTLVATDANPDTITFGIAGGTDAGATVSKVGTYGTLTVNETTGAYTFAPNATAINAASSSTSYSFTVTASDGAATDTESLTINVAGVAEATGVTVGVQTYVWKSHMLLDGVELTLGGGSPATTDASGAASFAGVTGTSTTLTASRAIPEEADATSAAANLQDAIAILKMIVGLDVNGAGNALSPYQALAADYDANGSVQLTDAIGVLKHVVGLTAPDPAWFFLNEADLTVPGKAGLTPGTVASNIDASVESHVGLVGVLRGDVDGSYAGPSGATDLDVANTTYFTDLVASHTELSLSQFGIYP